MATSYVYTLVGTQPLVIDSVLMNGLENNSVLSDSINPMVVELQVDTSAGYSEGKSWCYVSETGEEDSYAIFSETNSNQHFQKIFMLDINLPAGKIGI